MFRKAFFRFVGVLSLCVSTFSYSQHWEEGDDFESVNKARKNWSQEQDLYSSPAYMELLDDSERTDVSSTISVVSKRERARSEFDQNYGARSEFLVPHQRMSMARNFDRAEANVFLSLPLSEDDKRVLRDFVVNLDVRTVEELMGDRDGIEAIKQKLDSLHPLRLAGFIFSDDIAVAHARNIMNTDVKLNLFVILMQIEIQTSKENGSLNRYLPGFIDYLGLDANTVWSYINSTDYHALIRYMLKM
jgi:hypothetical protein